MRPIHKAANTDTLRPAQLYIQVKGNFVRATDAHIAVKLPVCEVFPEGCVRTDEELYFEAKQWGAAKLDKAFAIKREGLLFTAIGKKDEVLGHCFALSAEQFREAVGLFPDTDCVMPTPGNTPTGEIGLDFEKVHKVCSAFGAPSKHFLFELNGRAKGLRITHVESEGVGILMPVLIAEKIVEEPVPEAVETPSAETPIEDLL